MRRDLIVPALREIGFDVSVTPESAFYVYAGCGRLADDSAHFAAPGQTSTSSVVSIGEWLLI